jgi:hypothetical protein
MALSLERLPERPFRTLPRPAPPHRISRTYRVAVSLPSGGENQLPCRIVYIHFVGTHAHYDTIDVTTI